MILLEKNQSSLTTDIKISSLDSTNKKSQMNMSSLSPQQGNRHYCNHPDCTKVNYFFNKKTKTIFCFTSLRYLLIKVH